MSNHLHTVKSRDEVDDDDGERKFEEKYSIVDDDYSNDKSMFLGSVHC